MTKFNIKVNKIKCLEKKLKNKLIKKMIKKIVIN